MSGHADGRRSAPQRPEAELFVPELLRGWKGSVASNITSHAKAGIGAWSDEDIKRALTQGIAVGGRELDTPMKEHTFYFRKMTDEDINALVAWLHTVPPLE
jgi:hypothetical protein